MLFKLESQNLITAVNAVKKVMDVNQKLDLILVKVRNGAVDFCFSDSVNQYIKRVDAETDGEVEFIVSYDKISGIVAASVPVNTIGVNPIEFTVSDDIKSLSAIVVKYIAVGDSEGKEVSRMTYNIPVDVTDGNMKYQVLTRVNYDELLDTSAGSDEWSGADLKEIVSNLSTNDEKDTVLYISSKDHLGQSKNLNFVCFTKLPFEITQGFSIKASTAQVLVDVASKFKGGNISVMQITPDIGRFVDTDCTEAIQFTMGKRTIVDKSAFSTYTENKIGDIRVVMHKGAFQSALNTISSTNQQEKNTVKIVDDGNGGYSLNIKCTGSSGSVMTDINVAIEKILFADGVDPLEYEAVILMKTFKHLLTKCKNDWFMMNMNTLENRFAKVIDVAETEAGPDDKTTYFFPMERE